MAPFLSKLQPKLRMIANGSTEVNTLRAEQSAAVAVPPQQARKLPRQRGQEATPPERPQRARRAKLRRPSDARVSAFVQLVSDRLRAEGLDQPIPGQTARKDDLVTVELPIAEVLKLSEQPWVRRIELGEPLETPTPVVTNARPRAPSKALRTVDGEELHGFGEGVLVGIVDVGGFDFSHPDFLDGRGRTRFARIWDQGGTTRPTPFMRRPASKRQKMPFDYGAELVKEELDVAIAAAKRGGLPAWELERQSTVEPGSHGTHVASIAAGNLGVCRKATLAAVLLSLPPEQERRESFYDSSRLVHAVDYLLALGRELGMPVSINVSLGTNGHAHDDSSPVCRWIDAALTRSGQAVSVAAGNAGQERAESPDDVGFIMGRIHASGQIAARELVADLEWTVVGNTVVDLSENELEVWYGAQDRFAIQVKPPGQRWTEVVKPGQFIENRQLPDGSFLSVYNELYHPANGANTLAVYLSPQLQGTPIGIPGGQWLVRLIGLEVRDGRYHAWIQRDDPQQLGPLGQREAWAFPSFFSQRSFVDDTTVSSLACGQRIVSVANLEADGRRVNVSSSQGPTRDGREKPDVVAPGTDVVAAKAFSSRDEWVAMTGTSMASPYVAGVVGLMLAANPELTGAQIGGILERTAQPLPGSDFHWRNDAGSGAIAPERCVSEAALMRPGNEEDLR
jgi:subtilisin family serine protease